MGGDETYYGYIVLRQTVKGTRIGTTYLSLKPLMQTEANLRLAK